MRGSRPVPRKDQPTSFCAVFNGNGLADMAIPRSSNCRKRKCGMCSPASLADAKCRWDGTIADITNRTHQPAPPQEEVRLLMMAAPVNPREILTSLPQAQINYALHGHHHSCFWLVGKEKGLSFSGFFHRLADGWIDGWTHSEYSDPEYGNFMGT